jgi:hypothetical protein
MIPPIRQSPFAEGKLACAKTWFQQGPMPFIGTPAPAMPIGFDHIFDFAGECRAMVAGSAAVQHMG